MINATLKGGRTSIFLNGGAIVCIKLQRNSELWKGGWGRAAHL